MYTSDPLERSTKMTDDERIRALPEIEKPAAELRWRAKTLLAPGKSKPITRSRRWSPSTCTILAKTRPAGLTICEGAAEDIQAGAVRYVTGRGNHSAPDRCFERWSATPLWPNASATAGPCIPRRGCFILIVDPDKAPAAARGALGWPILAGGLGLSPWSFWSPLPLGLV